MGRLVLQVGHLGPKLGRNAVAASDEAGAHALLGEVRQLALDRLAEDLHQLVDLRRRTQPVLGGEGVDGQGLDAEIDRRLHGPPQRARAFTMAVGDRQALLDGPAAVPVHDDRDGTRDLARPAAVLGAGAAGGRGSPN